MILSLLLIIPLLGSLFIAILPNLEINNHSKNISFWEKYPVQIVSLITSVINFILSLILILYFNDNSLFFQFIFDFLNVDQLIYSSSWFNLIQNQGPTVYVGIDGLSVFFVFLTTIITPICILASWNTIIHNKKYFYILFLLLETLQIAVFIVMDLLLFYIFFESVLIPLFFVVGIWGASLEKIRASFLLFLYTLWGSLFMLLSIMTLFHFFSTTDLPFLSVIELSDKNILWLWLGFFLSFAVKTPLLPFHLWLFRAHAEAPLAGSILLAAIILKLATYGFLRIILTILPNASSFFIPMLQGFAIITLIYSSISTLRQIDLKALVAYSSVAHMAVVILGLFSNSIQGLEGAITLSIAHGFVSPALFICVGGILYYRFHSRIIYYYRGLALIMPMFSILFLFFVIFNTAIPLSLNWIGEFLALAGTFKNSPIVASLGATGIVLSACYSVWMFNRISYGDLSSYLKPMLDINRLEFSLLFGLLVITLYWGIFPDNILEIIHVTCSNIQFIVI